MSTTQITFDRQDGCKVTIDAENFSYLIDHNGEFFLLIVVDVDGENQVVGIYDDREEAEDAIKGIIDEEINSLVINGEDPMSAIDYLESQGKVLSFREALETRDLTALQMLNGETNDA